MKLNSEALLSVPETTKSGDSWEKLTRTSGLTDDSKPVTVDSEFLKATNRSRVVTTDEDKSRRQFSRQYAHAYAIRLWSMRPHLEKEVEREWKHENVVLKKIAELCESNGLEEAEQSSNNNVSKSRLTESPLKRKRQSDDHGQHIAMREHVIVAIIGTIFKQQPEKPSILQELVEDNPMIPVAPKTNYTSEKDFILLEDETTRVQLVLSEGCGMAVSEIVNGVVCGVKGKPTINGKFEVEEVIYPTPSPAIWPSEENLDVEMIFLSGLHLGSCRKNLAQLDLLFDYLQGLVGCPDEHEKHLRCKSRLFILGDLFGKIDEDKEKLTRTEVAKKLDSFLDQISQTMEVFILPGETDPAEPMFPQAPIHRCVTPLTARRKSFFSLCNPTRINVPVVLSKKSNESISLILSGGQNVKDVMKNTLTESCIDVCNNLLRWGHLCPTAPDTLPLHPGIKDDIFVLKESPHFFVVGNQESLGMREWKSTKILTLPSFAASGVGAIIDKSFNIVPLTIKLSL